MAPPRVLRRSGALAAALAVLLALAAPATALPDHGRRFPAVIDLPTGFQPEGIVVAPGGTAYAGSLADGSIAEVDLRTGEISQILDDPDDTPAVGIEYVRSSKLLYVAGGGSGTLEVVDPRSGDFTALQVIEPGSGFLNDVAVSGDTIYVTESFGSTLYAVEIDGDGFGDVHEIPLGGDFEAVGGFNANGIVALPDGTLMVIQSATGTLYAVDPDTGEATAVDLDGELEALPAGDGIERQGQRLYVVQNQLNQIAVVDLRGDPTTGTVRNILTDPAFDVPTTVDRFGSRLYVVNARFGIQNPGSAAYQIVGTELR